MSQTLFGKNSLIEILKAGRRQVVEVFLAGKGDHASDENLLSLLVKHHIPFKITHPHQLESLAGSSKHQGVVFKVGDFKYSTLESLLERYPEKALFVIADSLQDPHNLGAVCRSAHCFGADGIILNKDRSAEVTSTVSKASAGAVEHLDIVRVTNLARAIGLLKDHGFWIYAAGMKAPLSLDQISVTDKMALVIGSEGEGIRPLVLKNCDFIFSIPMARDFDSLNVAQATTVALYEIARKRG